MKIKGYHTIEILKYKEFKGEYIALMDANDISDKHRIKKLVEFLNKDIDVVSSNIQYFCNNVFKSLINKFITLLLRESNVGETNIKLIF